MAVTLGRVGRYGAVTPLVAAALLVLTLGGCSNRVMDAGLLGAITGDGPPPDAPSPVRGISEEGKAYPNLGTVPDRPADLPTAEQRARNLDDLEQDRERARAAAKTLEERYKPVPVPPKPALTPGKRG